MDNPFVFQSVPPQQPQGTSQVPLQVPSQPPQRKPLVHQKFSPQEDQYLKQLVEQSGTTDWNAISRAFYSFGSVRNPRQCRERYKNYLAPGISKLPWTEEEDSLLLEKYQLYGPQWVKISKFFQGRTDINVKNRWTTKFKKAGIVPSLGAQQPQVQQSQNSVPASFDLKSFTSNQLQDTSTHPQSQANQNNSGIPYQFTSNDKELLESIQIAGITPTSEGQGQK